MRISAPAVLIVASLTACAPVWGRDDQFAVQRAAALNRSPGTIEIGDAGAYVVAQWGEPSSVSSTRTADGATERWDYCVNVFGAVLPWRTMNCPKSVDLVDGRVSAISESPFRPHVF